MTATQMRRIYTPGQKSRPGVGGAKNPAFAPLFNAWVRAGVEATTMPPNHDPGHNLRAGVWFVVRKHVRKTYLELHWWGPYQVTPTTTTVVKCAELTNWIHASHTKKVACPLGHEETLLKAPTIVKQVATTEPEKEQREPEIDQEFVEDGSITLVRDDSEEL
ncbi:hypothetical protein NDU88_006420 [Pleurodeles waltl]|uniref:Murine leukemia virus integrase C-terminal domain-containing protein n=1 Tax=Pleurodeles waltl TaxID=8319 RepID=A0AAV7VLW7_PLEWA|nr:hypothetical protein NDU88_006420 [Pleurodeles waltl]